MEVTYIRAKTTVNLAIKLRSKDLKHLTLENGHQRLQGEHLWVSESTFFSKLTIILA